MDLIEERQGNGEKDATNEHRRRHILDSSDDSSSDEGPGPGDRRQAREFYAYDTVLVKSVEDRDFVAIVLEDVTAEQNAVEIIWLYNGTDIGSLALPDIQRAASTLYMTAHRDTIDVETIIQCCEVHFLPPQVFSNDHILGMASDVSRRQNAFVVHRLYCDERKELYGLLDEDNKDDLQGIINAMVGKTKEQLDGPGGSSSSSESGSPSPLPSPPPSPSSTTATQRLRVAMPEKVQAVSKGLTKTKYGNKRRKRPRVAVPVKERAVPTVSSTKVSATGKGKVATTKGHRLPSRAPRTSVCSGLAPDWMVRAQEKARTRVKISSRSDWKYSVQPVAVGSVLPDAPVFPNRSSPSNRRKEVRPSLQAQAKTTTAPPSTTFSAAKATTSPPHTFSAAKATTAPPPPTFAVADGDDDRWKTLFADDASSSDESSDDEAPLSALIPNNAVSKIHSSPEVSKVQSSSSAVVVSKWSPEEHQRLAAIVASTAQKDLRGRVSNWSVLAATFPNKTVKQCRDHWYNTIGKTNGAASKSVIPPPPSFDNLPRRLAPGNNEPFKLTAESKKRHPPGSVCCHFFKSTRKRPVLEAECQAQGITAYTEKTTRFGLAALLLPGIPAYCAEHQHRDKNSTKPAGRGTAVFSSSNTNNKSAGRGKAADSSAAVAATASTTTGSSKLLAPYSERQQLLLAMAQSRAETGTAGATTAGTTTYPSKPSMPDTEQQQSLSGDTSSNHRRIPKKGTVVAAAPAAATTAAAPGLAATANEESAPWGKRAPPPGWVWGQCACCFALNRVTYVPLNFLPTFLPSFLPSLLQFSFVFLCFFLPFSLPWYPLFFP
jgi:hypothetical protein